MDFLEDLIADFFSEMCTEEDLELPQGGLRGTSTPSFARRGWIRHCRGCGGTVTGRYLCVLRGTLVCLRRRLPTGSLTDWRNLCKDGDGKSCGVRGSHTVLESQKNSLLAPVPTRTEFRVEDHRKCVEWVFSLALASWYGGGRTQGGMPMGQEEGG